MNLTEILNSDPALALAGTIIGGLWSIFKARALRRDNRQQRYDRAIHALEAGVDDVYRTYVRELKRAREDGRLTSAEAARARRLARERAIEYGRHEGIDVLREIGSDYLDLWISKILRRARA